MAEMLGCVLQRPAPEHLLLIDIACCTSDEYGCTATRAVDGKLLLRMQGRTLMMNREYPPHLSILRTTRATLPESTLCQHSTFAPPFPRGSTLASARGTQQLTTNGGMLRHRPFVLEHSGLSRQL